MGKVSDAVNKIAEYATAVMLFMMVVILFTQVFFRFVLQNSLSWSEEVSRYLFIWISLLGVSIGVKRGFLVSISILTDRLQGIIKKMTEIGCSVLILLFGVLMVYYGLEISLKVANQLSPAMRISMSYVYFSVPVSGLLIIIHIIPIIVEQLKMFRLKNQS